MIKLLRSCRYLQKCKTRRKLRRLPATRAMVRFPLIICQGLSRRKRVVEGGKETASNATKMCAAKLPLSINYRFRNYFDCPRNFVKPCLNLWHLRLPLIITHLEPVLFWVILFHFKKICLVINFEKWIVCGFYYSWHNTFKNIH